MSLGWGNLAGAIGEVVGKAATFFQGRIEKLKNERQHLMEEKLELLRGEANASTAHRMVWVTARIAAIDEQLRNKSQD